jgi:hypothetical protein
MDGQTITPDLELESEAGTIDASAAKVSFWRWEQLTRAGYSHELAHELAQNHAVDLHRACDLLRVGCPPQTAYDILA